MATVAVTDDEFEAEVINADGPVLVDFWAEWCGPCQVLGPVLEEVSEEMSGKVKIVKVNIDKNPNAPTKYGVRSIPTLLMFKSGEVAAQTVGASSKSDMISWLEQNI